VAVKAYNVTVSDLTHSGGTAKIPASDINVFKQGYVWVGIDRTLKGGWIPDMLLPMELAVEHNENKIEAGKNQGITFDFKTRVSTVPGLYTGSFTISVDGFSMPVPVAVEVWDIDLSQSHIRSIACTTGSGGQGEGGDSTYQNSVEVFDLLLDYRFNPQHLPRGLYSPKDFLSALNDYFDHPWFNSYQIPWTNVQTYEQYLYQIAAASTPSRLLLTKAQLYQVDLDEPNNTTAHANVITTIAAFNAAEERVIARLAAEGFFTGWSTQDRAAMEASIRDIPQIITTNSWTRPFPAGSGITYCTSASFYGLDGEIMRYDKSPASGNAESRQWIYPNSAAPVIGYSLPNQGSTLRLMSWAMSKYDIAGVLNWEVTQYKAIDNTAASNTTAQKRPRDYYGDARSWIGGAGNANWGDGYILYPGTKYGCGPLPSLRLMHQRDGFEDHELLYVLQKRYEQLAAGYGVGSFDQKAFAKTLEWLYYRGFRNATNHDAGGNVVMEMRKAAVDLYLLANSGAGLMWAGSTLNGATMTSKFYVAAGWSVRANGSGNLTPTSGRMFTVTQNINSNANISLQLILGGTTLNFGAKLFEFGGIIEANLLPASVTAQPTATIGSNTGSASGGAVQITIPARTVLNQSSYSPYFGINANVFSQVAKLYDANYIGIDLEITLGSGSGYRSKDVPLAVYLGRDNIFSRLNLTSKLIPPNGSNVTRQYYLEFMVDRLAAAEGEGNSRTPFRDSNRLYFIFEYFVGSGGVTDIPWEMQESITVKINKVYYTKYSSQFGGNA